MGKILLSSADPMLLKSLYGTLRADGHEVVVSEHPAEAARLALSQTFDVVMLDRSSAGLSAVDAARVITSATGDVPVFIAGHEVPLEGFGWVAKPVNVERFRQAVRDIMCSKESRSERRVGDQ